MRAGQAVTDNKGNIGIITEPVKKSGIHKGKVAVMWVGMNYTVSELPEDLTLVELTVK